MQHSLARAIVRVPWWLAAIALLALVPRLLLVPFSLPDQRDPDERLFFDSAWQMVDERPR